MRSGLPKLFFVAAFVVNCIIWSHSRFGQINSRTLYVTENQLAKRTWFDLAAGNATHSFAVESDGKQCYPISLPREQQCTHVHEACLDAHTVLSIPYLRSYFCTKPSLQPVLFTAYVLWLIFLFSTLGISASDFFCPNLGTIAHLLGLDENVAGVTFLAFGNGSPDVFATFSAMRTNSGGLAIGELLGAAAFVTSCVVGSMCIIKPFKVGRVAFLRDVGFFTVAVILLLFVLWDSKIEAWEAAGLIMLYVFYVTVVVVGSWWERNQERKRVYETLIRDEYRDEDVLQVPYHDEEVYTDELSPSSTAASTLRVPSYSRSRAISNPAPPRLQTDLPARPHTRSSSPHSQISHMPSFSLIGALEFRRVVSSLQREAAGSSLSLFESPLTPYPGGHYHNHHRSRSRTPTQLDEDRDPWDVALGVPLDERSPRVVTPALTEEQPEIFVENVPIPTISRTPASPLSETDTESQHYVPPTRRQRIMRVLAHTFHLLFPTLHNLRAKSFLGKLAALFAAPAVMALTLTLPVVVTSYEDMSASEKKISGIDNRLIDFEEEGVERALIAEEEISEEMHELKFNKWLMAMQCTLGPLFCVAVLFDGMKQESWLLLATGVTGFTCGILVAVFADKGTHPSAQLARCSMGFTVAVVWIMAIADEVVQVLQTFGFIFGLSDAIIGITIFAVGNSLADLVANMSVAVFAPIMGFSACFGGPMLNILLGVGISGSYIIRKTGYPYPLHFSTSLVITGTGLLAFLLATLIFVPWNGYFLPRSWGFALIAAYVALMAANIVVEAQS